MKRIRRVQDFTVKDLKLQQHLVASTCTLKIVSVPIYIVVVGSAMVSEGTGGLASASPFP